MSSFQSSSSQKTKQYAVDVAGRIVLRGVSRRGATVVSLVGDLGAGKTTFVQGFLRALNVRGRITSPTFVLMKRYALRCEKQKNREQGTKNKRFKYVFHIDAYRLKSAKDIVPLGVKNIFSDQNNIVLIEWAERIARAIPKNAIAIRFFHGKKENERTIVIGARKRVL